MCCYDKILVNVAAYVILQWIILIIIIIIIIIIRIININSTLLTCAYVGIVININYGLLNL